MFTPPEASEALFVKPTTVQKWCRDYRIGIRIGGRWRIPQEAVDLIRNGTPLREVADRVRAA